MGIGNGIMILIFQLIICSRCYIQITVALDHKLFLVSDYIKSCASIEVCRQVVVAMDRERTSIGRLGYTEFKARMENLSSDFFNFMVLGSDCEFKAVAGCV